VHAIKRSSSLFINREKLCIRNFAWQEGFGAFTYNRSQLDIVYQYILNQAERHKKITFRKECIDFLKKYEIEYDERFLFDFLDDVEPLRGIWQVGLIFLQNIMPYGQTKTKCYPSNDELWKYFQNPYRVAV